VSAGLREGLLKTHDSELETLAASLRLHHGKEDNHKIEHGGADRDAEASVRERGRAQIENEEKGTGHSRDGEGGSPHGCPQAFVR